jgi:Protein of unknown function (DUF3224)
MATQVKGMITVTDWKEAAYQEAEGQAKLAQATSQAAFTGAIEGAGRSDWLLVYPVVGAPSFIGLQNVTGRLDGREGSFTLRMNGIFDEAGPHIQWSVVPDSGTGELAGLRGTGGYEHGGYTLDYELGT